jgi:hypothetical protein
MDYQKQIEHLKKHPSHIQRHWEEGWGIFQFLSPTGQSHPPSNGTRCGCVSQVHAGGLDDAIELDKATVMFNDVDDSGICVTVNNDMANRIRKDTRLPDVQLSFEDECCDEYPDTSSEWFEDLAILDVFKEYQEEYDTAYGRTPYFGRFVDAPDQTD